MDGAQPLPAQMSSPKEPERPTGFGSRHCQAFMTFLCLVVAYSMRVNLSVGIVAMTKQSGSNSDLPVLSWSLTQQSTILSSFFWGYMMLQMPAGHLSRKLGPKYLLLGATMVCSLVTLLTPFIALHCGWVIFCLSRVVQGLAQGVFFPSINTHLSKWAPPVERSRMVSFVFGGSQFGTVVTLFVAGQLAASSFGWPSIFYATGACGLLWSLAWLVLGADSPDTHSSISDPERVYIKSALVSSSDDSKMMATPWRKILTSGPMWALLIVHLGQNYGYWTLLTMLPTYMGKALHFDIKSNGLVSSLPYVGMWALTFVFSWAADLISQRNLLPLSVSRKMWNTIAHWGGAAALVGLSLAKTSFEAVVLLTISGALNAGVYVGFLTNHLDLSPNFSGLLMGMTNGLANITSILGPMVTGYIVEDETSRDQWMEAFYIAAAVFFVGNLVFIVFGSTEVQPWNEPSTEDEKIKKQQVAASQCYKSTL